METFAETSLENCFEHERLTLVGDRETGLRAAIAIHSTRLGPAMGGARLAPYRDLDEAVADALRLAAAMTSKNAAAGLALGGGKAVLLDDGGWSDPGCRADRLRAFGAAIDSLGGAYVTAEDVGTTPDDMEEIAVATMHVAGRPGGSGDPGTATARTVFGAIRDAVAARLGTSLAGEVVGVLGVGRVGSQVAAMAAAAGAEVLVADALAERAADVAARIGASAVPAAGFSAREMTVFAPCALGGAISAQVLPSLRCSVIAGAANNQLTDRELAEALADAGVFYVPDFIANRGGIIHVGADVLGFGPDEVEHRMETAIAEARELIATSVATRVPALELAELQVAERLAVPAAGHAGVA